LGEDTIVYYCVDEYTKFSGVNSTMLEQVERRLIDKADLVVVSAERLLTAKSSLNAPTLLLRHGVDYEHFRAALDPATKTPSELSESPQPIIGYFGLMSEDWIDLPLLVHLARSFPTGTLVMLGKSTMDLSELEREPNVRMLGRKPYESLPAYCKGFDVAIIPFPISEVTLNANPLKAREYLAAGLPVVSTAIPEVEALNACLIGRTPEEFVARVREALQDPGPNRARSQTMQSESWEARVARLNEAVANLQPSMRTVETR
jgi:glycosyltransferase involved in cell wall biosynthesis